MVKVEAVPFLHHVHRLFTEMASDASGAAWCADTGADWCDDSRVAWCAGTVFRSGAHVAQVTTVLG